MILTLVKRLKPLANIGHEKESGARRKEEV